MFTNEKIMQTQGELSGKDKREHPGVKTCKHCNSSFEITDKDLEFLEKLSPSFGDKKYSIPTPNDCPACRRQKRLSWRNTSKLYRRKCSFSGKEILAFYDETVKHPVYELEMWNSDRWNPLDYGQSFDFSKSFFGQFEELKNSVPHFSRSILRSENSLYSNNASNLKNCYLCFNGGNAEDSYYCFFMKDIKNSVDCYSINLSENCYDSVDIKNCNKIFFSQDSEGCFNSYFLKNCVNSKNCFLCKNLVGKEYYILNKSYSKQEYEEITSKLLKEKGVKELKNIFADFSKKLPEKYIHSLNSENITGDYINNSKDIFASFDIIEGENLRYSTCIKENSKNLLDVDIFGWGLENCYNSCVIGHDSSKIYFSFDCWDNIENLYYCSTCVRNIKNCFGCVGLHDGYEYCILNKQYSKEEYEELIPKIIEYMIGTGEWGEFFPPKLSSYGYNQTEGFDFDVMDKKTALEKGFNWSDYEPPFPKVEKIIPAKLLPENIADIPDDILNRAIECEVTKKPFRIISQELEFYRKHNLPIPHRHPDQRHLDRMALRNPRKLFARICDKCEKNIKTTYSPDRPEIVYCEKCYNREIY